MIDDLDMVLRRLLRNRLPALTSDLQVRFEPPNNAWRDYVGSLSQNGDPVLALNLYLVDLRENRELRSMERVRRVTNGTTVDQPAPTRVNCHYLISAWDSAVANEAVQPTPDEHALLYDALAALLAAVPLNPARILGAPELAMTHELIRDADLPTEVLVPEGFPKLAEFWSAMGQTMPWRPVVYLVVTLPVAEPVMPQGPLVTTTIAEHRIDDGDVMETWTQIGGLVLDDAVAPPSPVPAAWVRLESTQGDLVEAGHTNAAGRFVFGGVPPGRYRLRWRSATRAEPPPREVDVPSPTGEYELRFPPP